MKPKPPSPTNRLMLAPGIRVSMGARARTRRINFRSALRRHGHVDRLTHPREGHVLVVADLERELVRAGCQLHVDLTVTLPEVHPGRRALHDLRSLRQTVGIDPDMEMAHAF